MLTNSQIREIARREMSPAGVVEKDYVLTKVLYSISKSKLDLVFKGGTAIKKVYLETGRFSEDLDFTVLGKMDLEQRIKEILNQIDMKMKIESIGKLKLSKSFTISFIGPLNYKNSFKIDLSLREKPELDPVEKEILHFYPDIPRFKFKVLKLEEILAEKLRAVYTRGDTKDITDVYFLSKLKINKKLVKNLFLKKLENVGVERVKEKRFEKTVRRFDISDIIYLLPASIKLQKEKISKSVLKNYSFLFD